MKITIYFVSQTNGLTERFNQTLSRCLSKMADQDQKNWDLKIETVVMGYRASRQVSKRDRFSIDNKIYQMRSHMFTWRMTSKLQLKPI